MRHYAGLSETRVAEVMGISGRAASQHTERGMAALRAVLDHRVHPGRSGAARLPR